MKDLTLLKVIAPFLVVFMAYVSILLYQNNQKVQRLEQIQFETVMIDSCEYVTINIKGKFGISHKGNCINKQHRENGRNF